MSFKGLQDILGGSIPLGSEATMMDFAERSKDDVKAEGQGTENRLKAWSEQTLPSAGGAQEEGVGPTVSTAKVTER